jgi:hypothetical protein
VLWRLVLAEGRAGFASCLLARGVRAGRGLRAADFLVEFFFLGGFAIDVSPLNRAAAEKWTLN